jgi:catechol 2,3-dioxygenase-like lactoylglutathione lyase family enzyme
MKSKLLLFICASLSLLSAEAKNSFLQRPKITGITSVAFYTKDLTSNISFYTNYLGFKVLNNNVVINKNQTVKLIPERLPNGNRLAYFSLAVDNAEAMRKYLLEKGIDVPKNPIKKSVSGNYSFFIKDPNGTTIQFLQNVKSKVPEKDYSATKIADKLRHVGFMVPDVDKANDFYKNILGFKETWRGGKEGENVIWINLKVPNGDDYLELMLYDKIQSAENMGVLNHICLEVENVDSVQNKLTTRTLPAHCKIATPIKTGINKKRQINTFDIDATRIEIMESKTIDGIPPVSSKGKPLKFIEPVKN